MSAILPIVFLVACSVEETGSRRQAEAETLCANVTDDNWRTALFTEPSHETCMSRSHYALDENSIRNSKVVRPCSFAGMPMFCERDAYGGIIVFHPHTFSVFIAIDKDDVARIEPHITWL